MELVDAYLARRALDYLVGFTLSPVLWRKLPGARSAGRVQSVALRLVSTASWRSRRSARRNTGRVEADVSRRRRPFLARLVKHEGKRLTRLDIGDEAEAGTPSRRVEAAGFKVALGREASRPAQRRRRRSPPRPCSRRPARKLGFSADRTMRAASGSTRASTSAARRSASSPTCAPTASQSAPEALAEARDVIGADYGARYVPEAPRHYQTKAKNAQEAHEAIRPTSLAPQPGRRCASSPTSAGSTS